MLSYIAYSTERCGGPENALFWSRGLCRPLRRDVVIELPSHHAVRHYHLVLLANCVAGPLLIESSESIDTCSWCAASFIPCTSVVGDEFSCDATTTNELAELTTTRWNVEAKVARVPRESGAEIAIITAKAPNMAQGIDLVQARSDTSIASLCHLERRLSLAFRCPRPFHRSVPPMVLVLLDGGADMGHVSLDGLTPLQAAASRFSGLSLIAANGRTGLLDPYRPGVACGSDTAHLSLFGFDPRRFFEGRGAFEALGGGMPLPYGCVAFKCNLAFRNSESLIVERRKFDADDAAEARNNTTSRDLSESLNGLTVSLEEVFGTSDALENAEVEAPAVWTVTVKYAMQHRCAVVISGPKLSARVEGTDPLIDGRPLLDPIALDASGSVTSAVIKAVARKIERTLAMHPLNTARRAAGLREANVLLLRGPAMRVPHPTFATRHGWQPTVITATCVISGLCQTLGFRVLPIPAGVTGAEGSNVELKADAILDDMAASVDDDCDCNQEQSESLPRFYFLHVKGCDEFSHHGDAVGKSAFFERVGRMLERLWGGVPDGTTIAVTADHTTPSTLRDHAADPVPIAVATKGTPRTAEWCDGVVSFDELSCASGSIGRIDGASVIPEMLDSHARAFAKGVGA